MIKLKDLIMTKTVESIVSNFNELAAEKTVSRAEVVLADFARKRDERLRAIADLRNRLAVQQEAAKTAKAKAKSKEVKEGQSEYAAAKSKADAAYDATFAETSATRIQADIDRLEAYVANADAKRNAFIKAFDKDPYAALANSSLVRSTVMNKIS